MVDREKEENDSEIKKRFEEIVRENTPRIFKMIHNMVDDYKLAEDLTQDVFLNAWKGFKNFRGDSSPYTWLYRIALNRVYQYRRKNKKRNEKISLEKASSVEDPTNPEINLLKDVSAEMVRKSIEKIPDRYQSVVVLRYFGDLKYVTISEILDIPVGTVRSRLHRGLTKLENILREGK